jgi:hypothetical protein
MTTSEGQLAPEGAAAAVDQLPANHDVPGVDDDQTNR